MKEKKNFGKPGRDTERLGLGMFEFAMVGFSSNACNFGGQRFEGGSMFCEREGKILRFLLQNRKLVLSRKMSCSCLGWEIFVDLWQLHLPNEWQTH